MISTNSHIPNPMPELPPTNNCEAETAAPDVKMLLRQPSLDGVFADHLDAARQIVKILRDTDIRCADVCDMTLLHSKVHGYGFACTYRGRGVLNDHPATVFIPVPEQFARSWLQRYCPDHYIKVFGPDFDAEDAVEIPHHWPDDEVDVDVDKVARQALDLEIQQEFGVDDIEQIVDPEDVKKVKLMVLHAFLRGPLARSDLDFVPFTYFRSLYDKWADRLELPDRFWYDYVWDIEWRDMPFITTDYNSGEEDLEVDWGYYDAFCEIDIFKRMNNPETLVDDYDLKPEWAWLRHGATESGIDIDTLPEWKYCNGLIKCSDWWHGHPSYPLGKALGECSIGSGSNRREAAALLLSGVIPEEAPATTTADDPASAQDIGEMQTTSSKMMWPIPTEARVVLEDDTEERYGRWDIDKARIIARECRRGKTINRLKINRLKINRLLTLCCNDSGEYFFNYAYYGFPWRQAKFSINLPVTTEYAKYWLARSAPQEYIKEFGAVYDLPDTYSVPDSWFETYIDACWHRNEIEQYGDILKKFSRETLGRCGWEYAPFKYAYDLYRKWFEQNRFQGNPLPFNLFVRELPCGERWTREYDQSKVVFEDLMRGSEYMIVQYGLTEWMPFKDGVTPEMLGSLPEGCDTHGLMRRKSSGSHYSQPAPAYVPLPVTEATTPTPDPESTPLPEPMSYPKSWMEYPIPPEARSVLEGTAEERHERWNPDTAERLGFKCECYDLPTHDHALILWQSETGEYFMQYSRFESGEDYTKKLFNVLLPVTENYALRWLYDNHRSAYLEKFGPPSNPPDFPFPPECWIDTYVHNRWSWDEIREYRHITRKFLRTFLPMLKNDFADFRLLHGLYCSWFLRNKFPGDPLPHEEFIGELMWQVPEENSIEHTGWVHLEDDTELDYQLWMPKPEPLISEHHLTEWEHLRYGAHVPDLRPGSIQGGGLTRLSRWLNLTGKAQG